MNIEEFREFCLQLKGTSEDFPFDQSTLVFKVMGKMYALVDVDLFDYINLKCDPEKAIELREQYPSAVLPGYHMSKKHWNSVRTDGGISDILLKQWITESYNLVVKGLPKKLQEELKAL
jgi:predicted DNA-binding protein (MmcQ/YjbR family)